MYSIRSSSNPSDTTPLEVLQYLDEQEYGSFYRFEMVIRERELSSSFYQQPYFIMPTDSFLPQYQLPTPQNPNPQELFNPQSQSLQPQTQQQPFQLQEKVNSLPTPLSLQPSQWRAPQFTLNPSSKPSSSTPSFTFSPPTSIPSSTNPFTVPPTTSSSSITQTTSSFTFSSPSSSTSHPPLSTVPPSLSTFNPNPFSSNPFSSSSSSSTTPSFTFPSSSSSTTIIPSIAQSTTSSPSLKPSTFTFPTSFSSITTVAPSTISSNPSTNTFTFLSPSSFSSTTNSSPSFTPPSSSSPFSISSPASSSIPPPSSAFPPTFSSPFTSNTNTNNNVNINNTNTSTTNNNNNVNINNTNTSTTNNNNNNNTSSPSLPSSYVPMIKPRFNALYNIVERTYSSDEFIRRGFAPGLSFGEMRILDKSGQNTAFMPLQTQKNLDSPQTGLFYLLDLTEVYHNLYKIGKTCRRCLDERFGDDDYKYYRGLPNRRNQQGKYNFQMPVILYFQIVGIHVFERYIISQFQTKLHRFDKHNIPRLDKEVGGLEYFQLSSNTNLQAMINIIERARLHLEDAHYKAAEAGRTLTDDQILQALQRSN